MFPEVPSLCVRVEHWETFAREAHSGGRRAFLGVRLRLLSRGDADGA